jgi:pyrroloquinoline-quinone synthase
VSRTSPHAQTWTPIDFAGAVWQDARAFHRGTGARVVHAVIEELRHIAESHIAVRHPYLQALAGGTLPDPEGAIRDLAFNYYAYSSWFQRYLTAAISQLEAPAHREILLRNLREEVGQLDSEGVKALKNAGIEVEWVAGYPHPVLFERFLDALGMDARWRSRHAFAREALCWSRLLLTCCQEGGAARAIGALGPGGECIVAEIYRPIVVAIDRHLRVGPRDAVFFALHCTVDDDHGTALNWIAEDLAKDRQNREELRNGLDQALFLRAAFFDAMYRRAIDMPLVER